MIRTLPRPALWTFVASLTVLALGCSDAARPRGTPVTPEERLPPDPPVPTLVSISPNVASTGGGASVRITGTNLPATVTIGGITVSGGFRAGDPPNTVLYTATPAHAAGPVDVSVADNRGRTAVLRGALTFASPESFDFNGEWVAYAIGDDHSPISFRVARNALVSMSCTDATNATWTLTFSPQPSVSNGEFSFAGADGATLSARIVSASQANGKVNIGSCVAESFGAGRS